MFTDDIGKNNKFVGSDSLDLEVGLSLEERQIKDRYQRLLDLKEPWERITAQLRAHFGW